MAQEVADHFRKRFLDLASRGFPLLRKIPDSCTERTLLAFQGLSHDEQNLYATAVGRGAMHQWLGNRGQDRDPSWELFFRVRRTLPRPSSESARLLLGRRARAPELRAAAKDVFFELFGEKPKKIEGVPGCWQYAGCMSDHEIVLEIDYGTRYSQFQYGVSIDGRFSRYFCYEFLYGMGVGNWNLVPIGGAGAAMEVLAEAVVELVKDVIEMDGLLDSGSKSGS